MKIVVTQDHWDRAKAACTLPLPETCSWCQSCVLALAFIEAGVGDVGVGYFNVTRDSGDGNLCIGHLPEKAASVRKSFDLMMRGINFKDPKPYETPAFPVEFEIEFEGRS